LFEKLWEQGNTIVLVTHEADIAARARRIIHIRDGKVEKDEQIK
jgi:putative ABC transport system ATP-binding protein